MRRNHVTPRDLRVRTEYIVVEVEIFVTQGHVVVYIPLELLWL